MQSRNIKLTGPFCALLFVGLFNLAVVACITMVQIFSLITLRVSAPSLSNISGIEFILILMFVAAQIANVLISKFTSATSQDANPPSDSYLGTRSRVRIFICALCFLIFVTT